MIKSCHSFLHGLLMPDLSELDARATLQQPLLCTDAGDWQTSTEQPGAFRICSGLTTRQGLPTKLTVDLRLRKGPRPVHCSLLFSPMMLWVVTACTNWRLTSRDSKSKIATPALTSTSEAAGSRGPNNGMIGNSTKSFFTFAVKLTFSFNHPHRLP